MLRLRVKSWVRFTPNTRALSYSQIRPNSEITKPLQTWQTLRDKPAPEVPKMPENIYYDKEARKEIKELYNYEKFNADHGISETETEIEKNRKAKNTKMKIFREIEGDNQELDELTKKGLKRVSYLEKQALLANHIYLHEKDIPEFMNAEVRMKINNKKDEIGRMKFAKRTKEVIQDQNYGIVEKIVMWNYVVNTIMWFVCIGIVIFLLITYRSVTGSAPTDWNKVWPTVQYFLFDWSWRSAKSRELYSKYCACRSEGRTEDGVWPLETCSQRDREIIEGYDKEWRAMDRLHRKVLIIPGVDRRFQALDDNY